MSKKRSDFWWLTPDEIARYKYVYVCHQEPYSDEPETNRVPTSVPRFQSLDTSGNLSRVIKRYPLEFIHYWREKCANTNVFRSFGLFNDEQDSEELLGPFLIDIDRDYESDKGYVQNLGEALEDTRRLVEKYFCTLKEDDFRIFFTGHKGFNIEVRPQALGIVSAGDRRQQFERRLKHINRAFDCGSDKKFVDKIHDDIRLHDSVNRWVGNNGKIANRMKFKLSLYELNSLGTNEICRRSERLASDYLSQQAV